MTLTPTQRDGARADDRGVPTQVGGFKCARRRPMPAEVPAGFLPLIERV